MPKKEVPLKQLEDYIPAGSYEGVMRYLYQHKVHLTVTRKRESILGDYRHKHYDKAHRISVNGNLNKYSFLITLLHELAHLLTFEKYGNIVAPHGKEWKYEFGLILKEFISQKIFPAEIELTLLRSVSNPAASSCGDVKLLRVLKKYDDQKDGTVPVEHVPENALFKIRGERIFRRGEKMRTRFKCLEIATKKWFLFSGLYEVQLIN